MTPLYEQMIAGFARRGLSISAIRDAMGGVVSLAEIGPILTSVREERQRAADALETKARAEARAKAAVLARYRIIQVRPVFTRPEKIVQAVAERNGLRPREMLAVSRSRHLVIARQEAMYELACQTRLSLPQIGRVFGGFDHTTILHGIRRHVERNGLAMPRGHKKGTHHAD